MKYDIDLDGTDDPAPHELAIANITPSRARSSSESRAVEVVEAQPRAADVYNFPERATWSDIRYILRNLLTSAPLALADLIAFAGCLVIVSLAHGWLNPSFTSFVWKWWLPLTGAVGSTYFAFGLYPGIGLSPVAEMRQMAYAVSSFCISFAMASIVQRGFWTDTGVHVAYACPLVVIAGPLLRRVARQMVSRSSWWAQPTLIFGSGPDAEHAFKTLRDHPRSGLRPIGMVDDLHHHWDDESLLRDRYLGPFEDACRLAEERGVSWGVVAMAGRPASELRRVVDQCAGTIPHVIIVPDMRAFPLARYWDPRCDFAGLPTLRLDDRLLAPVPRTCKRLMDLTLSALTAIVLSPLLLGIVLTLKLGSPGPAFYSQERIGYHGRRFRAWKFRTMVTDADEVLRQYLSSDPNLAMEWEKNHKLRDDPRVTRLGRWLRKFSADELPQLWNVLVGEMSLVGPRPIVEAEIEKYSHMYPIYLRVRPGLTGLWQVSGRNNTSYEERVHLDVQYVRDWSPWLDLDILFKTLRVVMRCDGAY